MVLSPRARWRLVTVILGLLVAADPATARDIVGLLLGPDGVFTGRLYGADVSGSVPTKGSGGGISIRRGDREVGFEFDSRAEFIRKVHRNEDAIVEILFPGGIEGSAQGVPGGARRALDAFDQLVDLTPRSPARPSKGTQPQAEVPLRNETTALFEYERFRVDGSGGDTYTLNPGLDRRWENLELGFAMPVRVSSVDDDIDTGAFTAGLDLHAKYHYYLNPRVQVIPLLGAESNVFSFDSDLAGSTGYIRYGGYTGVSTTAEFDRCVLGAGVVYSVSNVSAPSSFIADEFKPLAGALSDQPVDQQIVVGGKVAVPFLSDFLGAVGGRHLETIGASAIEDDKRALDQVSASLLYFPAGPGGVEVGYKYLFGAEDLHSSAAFLQGVLYF